MAEGTSASRARNQNNFIWRHWIKITRLVGITSCAVLWGISFSILHIEDKRMATYLFICSTSFSFLEVTFMINKIICCKEDTCCYVLWMLIMAIDNWKKTIIYASLSILCFLEPTVQLKNLVIAGIFMNIMAIFYMLKTVKDREPPEPYLYKQLEIG